VPGVQTWTLPISNTASKLSKKEVKRQIPQQLLREKKKKHDTAIP